MSNMTVGWDIGGAHLKAVLLNTHGEIIQVLQMPCPLWKGLIELESAMQSVVSRFNINNLTTIHAVTMTGELVDLFANRYEGVIAISNLAAKLLGKHTLFYAAHDKAKGNSNRGFVGLERVSASWACIASTNWHASASALAKHVGGAGDALLVDIGSTTTDIIAIQTGKVIASNLSDAARMADDSLVYTGVVRTPVMALTQKILLAGSEMNVAAEFFATMADVYRLTNELLPIFDSAETADGKGKTALESARRLARMVGHDVESHRLETWQILAKTCKAIQMNQIQKAVLKHLKPNSSIIGAGAGSFLVAQIAADLSCDYVAAYDLIPVRFAEHADLSVKQSINMCFPAYAVAILSLENQHA